jgi:hypothetical protein
MILDCIPMVCGFELLLALIEADESRGCLNDFDSSSLT